jgi:chromosome segregation ATPase
MTLQEIIVNNWELLSIAFNAILGYLVFRQQNALKRTETAATQAKKEVTQAQADLEETRNQGTQMKAVLDLFRDQMAGMARLVTAIEQGNEMRRKESDQHAKVVEGVMESNQRVVELITNFQNFSATQHNQTRDTVNAVGGKVDEMAANIQQAVTDASEFRKGLNGRFNHLDEQVKERFESLERNMQEALKKARDTKPLDPGKLDHAPDAGDGEQVA